MSDLERMTLIEYACLLADELDKAERLGMSADMPEGMRYIQISDTLARDIATTLRKKATR